jgi:hypothetical protein
LSLKYLVVAGVAPEQQRPTQASQVVLEVLVATAERPSRASLETRSLTQLLKMPMAAYQGRAKQRSLPVR